MTTLFPGYILDAGVVIGLGRRYNPVESRLEARKCVDTLIGQGLVVVPQEVRLELRRKSKPGDETIAWCNERSNIFHDLNETQQGRLAEVLAVFPEMVKVNEEGFDADPILVAFALDLQWTVVTEDGNRLAGPATGVHKVCSHFNVRCLGERDFLKEIGWTG
jgi:hypothetical protein